MDRVLHLERLGPRRAVPLADVPTGAIVSWDGGFWLRLADGLRRWSFFGYGSQQSLPSLQEPVEVVTPPSVCAVLAAGYPPRLHPSARVEPSAPGP